MVCQTIEEWYEMLNKNYKEYMDNINDIENQLKNCEKQKQEKLKSRIDNFKLNAKICKYYIDAKLQSKSG